MSLEAWGDEGDVGPEGYVTEEYAAEMVEEATAELRAELAKAQEQIYVPGLWRCAKCKLDLTASVLSMASGEMYANTTPQQCPNGCGPMWRVTERDERQDAQRLFNKEYEARIAAEAALAQARKEQ